MFNMFSFIVVSSYFVVAFLVSLNCTAVAGDWPTGRQVSVYGGTDLCLRDCRRQNLKYDLRPLANWRSPKRPWSTLAVTAILLFEL